MLYQLSYASPKMQPARPERLERETGIEPATNSLEGCDSTIELLPPGLPAYCFIVREHPALVNARQGPRDTMKFTRPGP
jgi:hypothetical protein